MKEKIKINSQQLYVAGRRMVCFHGYEHDFQGFPLQLFEQKVMVEAKC